MNEPKPGPPEYKVYRSRRNPLARLSRGTDLEALKRLLSRSRDGGGAPPRERGRITPGRVLRWLAIAVAAWIALSLVVFLVSSTTQEGLADDAESALSGGGNLFTGSTILVLGSDVRTGESIDESAGGPGRSDSIMLIHAAFGSVRKLSIPRDVQADIPGRGPGKINAAYAFGGPALAIETIEGFLGNGLEINHLVEVDFADFPAFVDSLGGITVHSKSRICAPPFDNFWKGIRFKKGKNELDGTRALGFARVRKNDCAPGEDDRDRAARQQEVLRAISDQVTSPSTFFRLPWVSWNAPRTLKTDMSGPSLLALFADVASGGAGGTEVLETSLCEQSGLCAPGNLFVSDGAKRDAVRKLLEGD